jgi:hypothetical protein
MAKSDLVPAEICTRCSKSIGAKEVACLWEGAIICSSCRCQLTQEKYALEVPPGSEKSQVAADWREEPATEKQMEYLEIMAVRYDPATLTKGKASDLIEDARRFWDSRRAAASRGPLERVNRFVRSVWLMETGEEIRENATARRRVRALAITICEDFPELATDINKLLRRKPHREEYMDGEDHLRLYEQVIDLAREWHYLP